MEPRIDGFEILKPLGRGGMGTVYLARDARTGDKVALKVLPQTAQDGLHARFELESHIGRRLDHPDIITTYDSGVTESYAWIAMEYLDGFELTEAIHDPELGFEDRVRIIIRVAAALGHAHERGVLHRDVKPSNIFITHEGEVRLLDFGVARYQDVSLTQSGVVVGTPRYMAPEQLMGGLIDRRADVFALGVVAFEVFCGVSPWSADNTAQLAIALCTKPPLALKEACSKERYGVDERDLQRLHQAVHKALALEPEDRHQSALDFGTAMEAVLRQADELLNVSALAMGARSVEWARARAARLQIQTDTLKPAVEAPPTAVQQKPDRSGMVWWGLMTLFLGGLVVALRIVWGGE